MLYYTIHSHLGLFHLRFIVTYWLKMATVQELLALGQQMGLDGTELKDFVTEQQALAREEREKER